MLWGDFNGYRIGLVQTLGDLEAVRGQLSSKTLCGIDTETTGLSYISDRVVGVCISCGSSYSKKDYAGFYFPIRHYGYSANLPVEDVISFTQYVVDNFRTAWWNRSFDFSMLELDGFRCPFVGGTHDIQFMAHEMFNEEYPKLKDFSKKLLKFQTILFEDNAAEANNFATTDPEVTFVYAGADALQTALLGIRIWEDYPQVHKIYALDNECGEAVRRMTKTPIRFDFDFLDSEVRRSTQRMLEIEQDIYRMVGYPFNVKSGRECADALSRFVTLTVKTKSGEYKVDKDILHSIDHPLAKLLLEHSAVSTYLSSFVKKMASWRKSGPIRLNYNLVVALTGRMSSSASKGNDYYSPLNAQNIPKIEEKQYLHPHPHIGYCLRPYEEGCIRDDAGKPVRYKTKAGLRHTFMADDGGKEDEWVFVGFDYASEEVALAANWSQDEGLLYPMKHGLDVHMYVAEKMFGVADPAFRSKSKAISFGKLYGGGPSLIASRLGISVDAAKDLIIHYDKTLPKLKHWQEWLKKNARRTGFAQTLFGRHIYVGRWFNSSDSGMRAYAERVSLNAPIQGSVPQSTYVVSQDGKTLHPWRDFVGQRVSFVDTRDGSVKQGVPTFRGVYDLHLVVFNTGDFCVCNDLHKFVKYGKEQVLLSLSQLGDSLTPLMPTHRKRWWSTICGLFSRGRETLSGIASRASMGRSFGVSDAGVAWCLFRSWLCGTRYVCRGREESAHALRSLCDLYGYNLVYDFKRSRVGHSVFKLKFGRKRRAFGVLVRPTGTKDNVISPCMCSGLPIYPLMGNVHKNTGGDLIRRDLVMLMKHMERDEEFRRNVEFQFTIHDEIQVRIRLSYLKRGIKVMQAIMSFWPKQFQTPLLTEPCVGFRLGGELDIDAVADDGFIIPKGFTPPQEYLDAHEGWFYIDQWFKVNKERRGITEW